MSISIQFDEKNRPIYNDYGSIYGNKKAEKNSWLNISKRVAWSSLPFVSLYKPFKFPITLFKSSWASWTNSARLYEIKHSKNVSQFRLQLLKTAVGIVGLASLIFSITYGILVTTGYSIAMGTVKILTNLQKGKYKDAMRALAYNIQSTLLLSFVFYGGLQIAVTYFTVQILLGLDQTQQQFNKKNYIESTEKLFLAILKGSDLSNRIKKG